MRWRWPQTDATGWMCRASDRSTSTSVSVCEARVPLRTRLQSDITLTRPTIGHRWRGSIYVICMHFHRASDVHFPGHSFKRAIRMPAMPPTPRATLTK